MQATGCSQIEHIIITHNHEDHTGGLEALKERWPDARVAKYIPEKYQASFTDHSEGTVPLPSVEFSALESGQVLPVEGATLQVIATPGHTLDHISLYVKEENTIIAGDCVLGSGTAVFSNLHLYLQSLRRLLKLNARSIYPGHGPFIEDATSKINEYITHRERRIAQVKAQLLDGGLQTLSEITAAVYPPLSPSLVAAAQNNTRLVLEALEAQHIARREIDAPNSEAEKWRLVESAL
jgi:glyoxylase-like metal-dependent hydrolase (beta-lactamase superfamily II)